MYGCISELKAIICESIGSDRRELADHSKQLLLGLLGARKAQKGSDIAAIG